MIDLLFFVLLGLAFFGGAVALLSFCGSTGINSAVNLGRLWDPFALLALARVV